MKDGDHWVLPTTQACRNCHDNAWPCVVKIRRRSDHFTCVMCRKGGCSHKELRFVELTGTIMDIDDRRKLIYQTLGAGEVIATPPPNGDIMSLWASNPYGMIPGRREALDEELERAGSLDRDEVNERSRAVDRRDHQDVARNAPTWRTRSASPRPEAREYRDERDELDDRYARPNPGHRQERYEPRSHEHHDPRYDARPPQHHHHHHHHPAHQLQPQRYPKPRYEPYPPMLPAGPLDFDRRRTGAREYETRDSRDARGPRDHFERLPTLAELGIDRVGLRTDDRASWDKLEAARLVGFYPPNSTDPRFYANNPRLSAAERAGLIAAAPGPFFPPVPAYTPSREDYQRELAGRGAQPFRNHPRAIDQRREYDPRDARHQQDRDERWYNTGAEVHARREAYHRAEAYPRAETHPQAESHPRAETNANPSPAQPPIDNEAASTPAGPSLTSPVAPTPAPAEENTDHDHIADGFSYPPLVPLPRAGYVSTSDAQKTREEAVDK